MMRDPSRRAIRLVAPALGPPVILAVLWTIRGFDDGTLLLPARIILAGNALLTNVLVGVLAAALAGALGIRWLPGATAYSGAALVTALTLIGWKAASGPLLTSHIVLFTSLVAAGALGGCLRSLTRHDLDAAGAAVAVTLTAALAPLLVGAALPTPPTSATNTLLGISPVVATAAAAGIDLLRSEPFYQISPVAHQSFDYPSWPLTVLGQAWFTITAASIALLRRRDSAPSR